jgi:UDP-N-acetylglucosamine 2-epimerase (non-hydrolysing)
MGGLVSCNSLMTYLSALSLPIVSIPDMKLIAVLVGTRPDVIKMAPVIQGLRDSQFLDPVVISTGQHRIMLQGALNLFRIRPNHELDVFRPRQELVDVTHQVLDRVHGILDKVHADMLLVQGDTTSAFAAALAAFYHKIPIGHVEAGLRTNDMLAPYPEEMNRRLTDHMSSVHFAPTLSARESLLREGTTAAHIYVTGNTVVDALKQVSEMRPPATDLVLAEIEKDPRPLLLVTAHRRESWGVPLRVVAQTLRRLAAEDSNLLIVFPIHRNPAVRESIIPSLAGVPNIRVIEPLDYVYFVRLMRKAHLILTDSGGIQEEAPTFRTPVLVMRDRTERPEALEAGSAKLVGTESDRIIEEVRRVLTDPSAYESMRSNVNPFGDGLAASRVVRGIVHFYGLGPAPEVFGLAAPLTERRSISS